MLTKYNWRIEMKKGQECENSHGGWEGSGGGNEDSGGVVEVRAVLKGRGWWSKGSLGVIYDKFPKAWGVWRVKKCKQQSPCCYANAIQQYIVIFMLYLFVITLHIIRKVIHCSFFFLIMILVRNNFRWKR